MDKSKPFVPGRFSTGIISADKIAPGYSHTSLEFSIFVMGDDKCSGFGVSIRLTGYPEFVSDTESCEVDALETLIRQVFQDMTGISHRISMSPEQAEQIQIEKNLLARFLQLSLPHIIETLT